MRSALALLATALAAFGARAETSWRRAVVEIAAPDGRQSGFFIDADGRIATRASGLGDAREVKLTLHDGAERTGRVIARDARRDLALVRVDPPSPAFLPLGSAGRAGDELVALGAGGATGPGTFAAMRVIDEVDYVEASVAASAAGGPLVLVATGDAIAIRAGAPSEPPREGTTLAVAAPEFDEAFACVLRLGGRCDATSPPEPDEVARVQEPPRPEREAEPARDDESASAAPAKPRAEASPYVQIPGTRVALKRPTGMLKSRTVSGLESPDGTIRITVTEVPKPFADASATYTEQPLAKGGVQLLGRQDLEIAGQPGLIAYARHGDAALWVAAFGLDEESVIISASAPIANAKEISNVIHETLVTARWDREKPRDPFAGLGWELVGDLPLRLAIRVRGDLTFTRDGALPAEGQDDPVLLIGRREGRVEPNERADRCRSSIEKTPGVRDVARLEIAETTRQGLSGCEMAATAVEVKTEKPVVLYELILFDGSGQYFFRGRVGASKQYRYLPELIETVKRFRRKG